MATAIARVVDLLNVDVGKGTFADVKFEDMSRRELYAVIATLMVTHQRFTPGKTPMFKDDPMEDVARLQSSELNLNET